MSDLVRLLGEQLKLIREAKGLNQEEVAERAGMSPPRISEIESGNRNITIKTLEKITNALDVDPSILFNFKNIDTDSLYEMKSILNIYNSLLMERGIDEVKYVVRSTKEMLKTLDQVLAKENNNKPQS